jgi:hypothetical protein
MRISGNSIKRLLTRPISIAIVRIEPVKGLLPGKHGPLGFAQKPRSHDAPWAFVVLGVMFIWRAT